MIDAGELASLQALWDSALDTTCSVVTRVSASDGAGGYTETETSTAYACRLQPAGSGSLALLGGLPVEPDAWLIMLPHDAVVSTTDRIESGGQAFEVRAVDRGRSNNYGLQARCTRRGA